MSAATSDRLPMFSAIDIQLPTPANLVPIDREQFKRGSIANVPDSYIDRLTDAECFNESCVTENGVDVDDFWTGPRQNMKWRKRHDHWFNRSCREFLHRRELKQPGIWITDNWSGGYFHWICEALARLELLSGGYDLSGRTLLLPNKYGRRQYVPGSLEPFNLGGVRYMHPFERCKSKDLLFPSHVAPSGCFHPVVMNRLRNRFRNHYGCGQIESVGQRSTYCLAQNSEPHGRRIYISRAVAPRRKIVNESELLPILHRHGFEIMKAETISVAEQLTTMASASCLVSNHGAGLTNMLTMRPGTRVLELRNENDQTPNCYYTLASVLDINFHYQMVQKVNQDESVYRSDMHVDPDQFDAHLTAMLNPSSGKRDVRVSHRRVEVAPLSRAG